MNKIKKILSKKEKKTNRKRGSETVESLLLIAISLAVIVIAFYPEIANLVEIMIKNLNSYANTFMLDLMSNL